MRQFCTLIVACSSLMPLPSFFGTAGSHAADDTFVPGEATLAAVDLLERESLTRKRVDARMCSRWLDAFLDRLDPKRMYFLKTDDAEFRRSESRLRDLAKARDFGFPLQVRERYRKRVAEATMCAGECLSLRHDYSLDETFPLRFATYAADAAELRERWRLRIKFESLIEKVHGVPLKDAEAQLRSRYARIVRQAREMTDERLCGLFLDSLASCFDPHSAYLHPEYANMFRGGLLRTYTLGLSLRETRGEYLITSVRPSLSSPGETDRLIGWHLLAIRRINGPVYDLVEIEPEDLSNLIRLGPLEQDTEVILELMNPATFARRTVTWPRFPSL